MAEIKVLNSGGAVLRFISNKWPITKIEVYPGTGGTIEKHLDKSENVRTIEIKIPKNELYWSEDWNTYTYNLQIMGWDTENDEETELYNAMDEELHDITQIDNTWHYYAISVNN